MKIQAVENPYQNVVAAYGDDYVRVGAIRYATNLIVTPDRLIETWTESRSDALTPKDMQQLATLDVEVVLLGTGKQLRFPRPELMRIMRAAGRGLETMDLPAACRTYNLLINEGRRVAAALLLD